MNLKELREKLAKKIAEARSLAEAGKITEAKKAKDEAKELSEQINTIEERARILKEADEIDKGKGEHRTIETFGGGGEGEEREDKTKKDAEKRGQDLMERRAVTVSSGSLLLAEHQASDIKGTFNQISSLIDRVKVVPLNGGESYQRAYEITYGSGDYTAEGADYVNSDVTFGYAEITKSKITAYSEESEEVQKLPAADYESIIIGGVSKSLRKKITREILVGTGGAGNLTGIFSANATAIDAATDMEISGIDNNTLDNIIFSYGGDEDVEDTAVLILSKADLKAFALLKDNEGRKYYDVKTNGNTGTIDGVPFIINSMCGSISDPATAAGTYLMAYGPLSNYELATFSPTDIRRSDDYKFRQGMIAHRGSVFIGGNVAAYNGFLRVKKAPTV